MKHKHHIIPKYMGGNNLPENLTPPIFIPLHAALHKDLNVSLMCMVSKGKRNHHKGWVIC